MMNYFKNCSSIKDVKEEYRKLAKIYHPDVKGGSEEAMKVINSQYDELIKKIINGSDDISDSDKEEQINLNERYREAIQKISHLPNINIELVGTWIWVSGDTKAVKDDIKEAGFSFSPGKLMWYFRGEEYKSFGSKKGEMSMEEIRAKYGSENIKKQDKKKVKAA